MANPTPPVFVPVIVQAPGGSNSGDLIPQITSLVASLAGLLWVVFAITLAVLFRQEIRNLLRKIKKGKLFGQEFEVEEELIELHEKLDEVAQQPNIPPEEISEVVRTEVTPESQGLEGTVEASHPPESDIAEPKPAAASAEDFSPANLLRSHQSPLVALMVLGREIDIEVRRTLAFMGNPKFRSGLSLERVAQELSNAQVTANLVEPIELFQKVRNRIIHGRGEPSESEILSALDSGYRILSALKAAPRVVHIVSETNIPLYSDPQGTEEFRGAKGIRLDAISLDGSKRWSKVFSTKRDNYKVGMQVSWQWVNEHLPTLYFRDEKTGELKQIDATSQFNGSLF